MNNENVIIYQSLDNSHHYIKGDGAMIGQGGGVPVSEILNSHPYATNYHPDSEKTLENILNSKYDFCHLF
jgi:hypothetical protein